MKYFNNGVYLMKMKWVNPTLSKYLLFSSSSLFPGTPLMGIPLSYSILLPQIPSYPKNLILSYHLSQSKP